MPNTKSKTGKRLLLAFVALALTLFGIEVGLRLIGLTQLRVIVRQGNSFRVDAPLRVLVAGDSIAYGLGVALEKTYPTQLQALLNERLGENVCQLLNIGVPGRNTSETLLAVQSAFTSGLRPDFVLATAGANNHWNWHLGTYFAPGNDASARLNKMLSGLRLWRLLQLAHTSGPPAALRFYPRNSDEKANSEQENRITAQDADWLRKWIAADLSAIDDQCKANGARLILVGYPRPDSQVYRAYETVVQERSIIFADCLDFGLPTDSKKDPYFTADRWHPNEDGYAAMAKIVAKTILPFAEAKLSAANR